MTKEISGWEEELMNDFCVMFERASRGNEPIDWDGKLIDFIRRKIASAVEASEREIRAALTVDLDTSIMLDGWEKYWTDAENGRYIEWCVECGNSKRIKEALSIINPSKE